MSAIQPIVGVKTNACVDGGDAAELQARCRAALAAASGLYVADASITGVGEGPRWMAEFTFVNDPNLYLQPAGLTTAYCVRGGDPAELQQRIQAVLSADIGNYMLVEIAGGGTGRDYMALILIAAGLG